MIFLVEDDAGIRELVIYALSNSGFPAQGFDTPSAFWQALAKQQPRMILLDIMLPEEDGLQILRKLRADPATRRTPVIMLTAKGSEYDKVLGLEAGADDYIPKPFGMMELIARVKALLRRTDDRENPTGSYTAGSLEVQPDRHLVTVEGQPVALTLKEFELLVMLLKNRGMVLTRDQLLNQIWGYSFDGENRTVDVHIRTLRQKLGAAGDLIETVRGVGYKIGGSVR
ncbi:MAG: response regulator transcription factor [Clostridia bacterium]|nr:response regulator transcription factor [Clostridia bacterium]